MITIAKEKENSKLKILEQAGEMSPDFDPASTIEWIGGVNADSYQNILHKIKNLHARNGKDINLVVTSPGGATGVAMSFYDVLKKVFRINLSTIGSGDVDSSGIIIFLTGKKRYITENTTMFLHMGGRMFEDPRRFTASDMKSMHEEDSLKDAQYASVVSRETNLSVEEVLLLMKSNTVLTAERAVRLGFAHRIIR